jgi:hypothetical protein
MSVRVALLMRATSRLSARARHVLPALRMMLR